MTALFADFFIVFFGPFCTAGRQQLRNKPSFLAHKQFLFPVFFHNLSACSMQHVQAKEDKCNIGTGPGEAHQTPNDFLWSNFSNMADTGDYFFD